MGLAYKIPNQKDFLSGSEISYDTPVVMLTEIDALINKIPFEFNKRKSENERQSWIHFKETDFYHYDFEIKDRRYMLDIKSKLIYNEIMDSKKYLDFADNWDDENAVGCNAIIYFRAIDFLIEYTKHILDYYNISIKAPEINLGRDGSIDLEWRLKNRSLLVNVLNTEKFEMHFYGRTKEPSVAQEGILPDLKINSDLSNWMQYLV